MREKELRLALVCYGGISLAVYMHGITREVWHLCRASRAHADATTPADAVEVAYAELIAAVGRAGGARLRVMTDIVAGASAGGINGIFLAQAIATGQSLRPLTDLWLDKADVDALIDPEARMASRFTKLWATPAIWAIAHRSATDSDDPADADAREEVEDKLSRFMRARWFEPPFGGEVFTTMLLDAFAAMAAAPPGPRLLPPAQPLDLFVSVTDFHGHAETLAIHSPPAIAETEHRLTLSFRDAPGGPDTIDEVPALAFAARATASFPGAFPPFSVAELDRVLAARDLAWAGRDAFLRAQFPNRREGEDAVLIDGSVLANAPFGPAIAALKERPARREIDRRFVYIDPKPGIQSVRIGNDGTTELPGFLATIFGAMSDIPREQPIRDNLDAIAQRSTRIRRMRAIVERLRPAVEEAVAGLFGRTFFLDRPTPIRLAAWRQRSVTRAATDAGFSYAGYLQLRVMALLERGGSDDAMARAAAAQVDPAGFLDRHDAGFRVRRLRFVARRLADLAESDGPTDALDHVRDVVYKHLAAYLAADGTSDLRLLDGMTDALLAEALRGCDREARRAALFAYLGFAFYDIATLPLLQGEGYDEFDEIKVDRVSPDDARSLRAGGTRATLKGIRFNSFGAFFSRAYRENDYLWGRLHGAERMVDIVASTLPANHALTDAAILRHKRALFVAILAEEAPHLTRIARLIETLAAELASDRPVT